MGMRRVRQLEFYGRAGDDTLISSARSETLVGGPGADTVNYSFARRRVVVRLPRQRAFGHGRDGLRGVEQVIGSEGADIIVGDSRRNWLEGGGGNDRIIGGGGNHLLDGGPGDDTLAGGPGSDLLLGGAGNDRLNGSSGRDILVGDTDAEEFSLQERLAEQSGRDTLRGGSGQDVLLGSHTTLQRATLIDQIMCEWTTRKRYGERVYALQQGTGCNRPYALRCSVTVFDDQWPDSLLGGAGLDLFFHFPQDSLRDRHGGEHASKCH